MSDYNLFSSLLSRLESPPSVLVLVFLLLFCGTLWTGWNTHLKHIIKHISYCLATIVFLLLGVSASCGSLTLSLTSTFVTPALCMAPYRHSRVFLFLLRGVSSVLSSLSTVCVQTMLALPLLLFLITWAVTPDSSATPPTHLHLLPLLLILL